MRTIKSDTERREKHAAYMREWNKKNPDKVKAIAKKKYWNNRESQLAKHKSRFESDPKFRADAIKRANDWQRANRDRRKAYMDAYYKANREKFLAKTRDWDKANPERARALASDYAHRRRARLRNTGVHLADKVKSLVEREARKQVHVCYYCKRRFKGVFHLDHILALSRQGRHEPSNVAIACPPCNLRKADKPLAAFSAEPQSLLNL